jgi:MinD superfamily P-loop ATPase
MKEIVIISGKGGTGKTSITAAIATLAARQGKAVFADCDVDAADLHLVFSPKIKERHEFVSGHVARVDPKRCLSSGEDGSCSKCIELCRFDAIAHSYKTGCAVDEGSCEGCGVCVRFCPSNAIDFVPRRCGEWYVSDTRFGPLVHAALDARAENSGKLVTTVRKEAKRIAEETKADWIIVDGSPGTGCPVIASITGADEVVIVTEPTMSGQHDLERVASLARHFSIPFSVVVNKADINQVMADATESWCDRNGVPFLGMIPYDRAVTKAQIEGKSVIEYCGQNEHNIPAIIGGIWEKICQSKR